LNPFIFSSPSRIWNTILGLIKTGELWGHILTTLYETILSFGIGISLGFLIAILLYELPILAKIVDPFLTMLNSLPKVALGPIIILWTGANTKSIIVMALLINLIVSILNIYNGFNNIDPDLIKLFKTFNAKKLEVLTKLIILEINVNKKSRTKIISLLLFNSFFIIFILSYLFCSMTQILIITQTFLL